MKKPTQLQEFEKFEKEELPILEADYKKSIVATVERWAMEAFEMGIEIPSVIIKDSWIENNPPYGNRHTIKAPDIKEIDAECMIIKIVKR